MHSKDVVITVKMNVGVSPGRAFEVIAPIDLRKIFTGYGFLPAVVRVDDAPPKWDKAGLSRNPVFSDGGTAREKLLTYQPSSTFSYQITDFTNVFGRMVAHIRGEWHFSSSSPGETTVAWRYTFTPKRGYARIMRYLVGPIWKRYMLRALRLACNEAARAPEGARP